MNNIRITSSIDFDPSNIPDIAQDFHELLNQKEIEHYIIMDSGNIVVLVDHDGATHAVPFTTRTFERTSPSNIYRALGLAIDSCSFVQKDRP